MIDKDLFALLGKDKKYIFYMTIVNLIGMIANVATTACICMCLYYATIKNTIVNNYLLYIGIAILMIIVKYITTLISGSFKSKLGSSVKKNLREKTYKKLLALGIKGTDEKIASITQMSIEGIEQLDLYYSNYLPQFFFALISPIILFIICVVLEWKTALVLLVCLPLIPISIIAVSKYAKKIFAKYWDKYTSMGDSFLDNIQGMKELKIFNADGLKQVEARVKAEEFRKITMKVLVMQLASITIMDLVAFGGAGVAIVMALISAQVGTISPIIALFLVLISAEFFLPMRALGSAFHIAMNGATAGKKILTFLDLEEPVWGEKEINNIETVKLENVDFSYEKDHEILHDVNMTFEKGFNSIVGESGCGKSTIVSLIIGSYKVDNGNILVNGNKVRDLNRQSYYDRLALVSYDTFVFNCSIRDNFLLAKNEITDEEIYKALELVNLKDFVNEIGGLDYIILENSENISGGQRQRLALAINLINKKDLYIFDEATSNIDIESEAIIMENIKELSKTKIVIVISHRLQNVVDSDVIYMLDKGRLIEQGMHNELLKINGAYNKIYKKQYDLENGYKEALNA